jgi:hypothetical protein
MVLSVNVICYLVIWKFWILYSQLKGTVNGKGVVYWVVNFVDIKSQAPAVLDDHVGVGRKQLLDLHPMVV